MSITAKELKGHLLTAISFLIPVVCGAGFIGGILGGYISVYIALYIIKNLKVPSWARGLMPTLIVPFIASFASGLIMVYIIGGPVVSPSRFKREFFLPKTSKS